MFVLLLLIFGASNLGTSAISAAA